MHSECSNSAKRLDFAFNIFVPIHVQEMAYLKAIQKSPQWTLLCREPSIKKRIWKNLGGLQPP